MNNTTACVCVGLCVLVVMLCRNAMPYLTFICGLAVARNVSGTLPKKTFFFWPIVILKSSFSKMNKLKRRPNQDKVITRSRLNIKHITFKYKNEGYLDIVNISLVFLSVIVFIQLSSQRLVKKSCNDKRKIWTFLFPHTNIDCFL